MAINTPPLSFILDFMEQRDVAGLLMKCNVVERGQDNTFSPLFIVYLKKKIQLKMVLCLSLLWSELASADTELSALCFACCDITNGSDAMLFYPCIYPLTR